MSDIKLFQIGLQGVQELQGQSVTVEKSLQGLIEQHSEAFLGIRFLATEYITGKTYSGRIDTLGLDENGCPVIIEYKRALNENVLTQGLYYLDWLLNSKADFTLLVLKHLGQGEVDKIDWTAPRLLCIAGDFTKYDEHAVSQINRNIDLMRYKRYSKDLLLLELVNAQAIVKSSGGVAVKSLVKNEDNTLTEQPTVSDPVVRDLFAALQALLRALGNDVQEKTLKHYYAFKRIKNFACVWINPKSAHLTVYVKVDPTTVALEKGFTRDVRNTGHWGTGDLEIRISSNADLEKAQPFLLASYEAS